LSGKRLVFTDSPAQAGRVVMKGNDSGAGKAKRTYIDRRSVEDRRCVYDLDYFLSGGEERRKRGRRDRRSPVERRKGWIRYNSWYSLYTSEGQ